MKYFNNFNKFNVIFKIVMIGICITFDIFVFLKSKDLVLIFYIVLFSIVIIGSYFIYDKLFHNYTKDILMKLSEMLATISDLKEREVFSQINDSMFSKLQYQTIKVTKLLKSQNKKIEKDKEEIKSLISDIAHQLKTPLTNMKMYSEFLQDDSLSKKERDEFNMILNSSLDRLCFLVENMIKMSRLESSVINLRPKMENIKGTIIDAITNAHKKAKFKHISINLCCNDDIYLLHDKQWTGEAIFNILENAIKYSPKDTTIDINVQKYEMFTRIDIKDEGIGILEEEIPRIFGRFYRGKNASEEEGIGIGLYLSREIIDKQDGYIKVSSSDKGSLFSIFMDNKTTHN